MQQTDTIARYPFIFSDEPRWKWRRHLAFWAFWWVFQGWIYSFVGVASPEQYPRRLASSFVESLIYLTAHIFLAYFLMYVIIPKYLLRQRYGLAVVFTVVGFLVAALLSSVLSLTIVAQVREYFLLEQSSYYQRSFRMALFLGWMAGLRGAITIAGIACAIKLMKHWYVKESRLQQLAAEHIRSQLELLKAQVHPHFLFNTLNNIYSQAQQTAPVAAHMILKLSDMLRYMLYETGQPTVALSQELDLVRNYVSLEQQRYGNQLEVQIAAEGAMDRWAIAPLLLLPLVENAFKHGASQMLEHPWVSFDLQVDDSGFCRVKLLNGKPSSVDQKNEVGGIGLQNLRRRLDLLYPGYRLDIVDEADVFAINLELTLEPHAVPETMNPQQPGKKLIHGSQIYPMPDRG